MTFFSSTEKVVFFSQKNCAMKWKLSAGSEENKIIHYRCFIKLEIIEQVTEFIFLGFFFQTINPQSHFIPLE